MLASNTASRYGSVAKFFHWTTALLIVTLFPLGKIANDMAYEIRTAATPDADLIASTAQLFSIHKSLGVAVFFVALARILWALRQPKPNPIHPDRKLEHLAAETVHWLLYSSLVIVPLSGWIHHAATTGFAPILWPLGQNLPLVPKSEAVAALFGSVHSVVTKVLLVALLAHVAGALKHALIDRDGTLARMWFGSREVAGTPVPHTAAPLIAAIAIWGAALGIGAGLGLYSDHGTATQAPALEEVASDWKVQEGTLSISVTQFGNAVEGSFANWTAAISFDAGVTDGQAGTVEVTVAIPSLTLGSVTDQAMGADYFNAEAFPTATFTADIIAAEGSHVARGLLRIKENAQPIEIPFTIFVDGTSATAAGAVTVNRLDWAIGAGTQDQATLAFGVGIAFDLTAARAQ